MYSPGGRSRASSFDMDGMKSISSTNLRYKGRGKVKKRGKVNLKKRRTPKGPKSKSRLLRALKTSYTVTESDFSRLKSSNSLQTIQVEKPKVKKRLSVNNDYGSAAPDRPLFPISKKSSWHLSKEIGKQNKEIKSSTQIRTFEEVNPETKKRFGSLSANIVSLKMELNDEFNTSIENADRKESDDSEESFIEIKTGYGYSDECAVTELSKGRQASRLLRNHKDLDALKKAMHNNYKRKKEARVKAMKAKEVDEELLTPKKKKSFRKKKKTSMKKLFSTARNNVSSLKVINVSNITKRLSRGAASLTLRSSLGSKDRGNNGDQFDLDDPNGVLSPSNIKKLHFLIAKNEAQSISKKMLQAKNEMYGEDEESTENEKSEEEPSNQSAIDKFKQHMERKKKESLFDKKAAFRSRRRKRTSHIQQRHDNVKQLEQLHKQKFNRVPSNGEGNGKRLHCGKKILRRRTRGKPEKERLETSSTASDSSDSVESLVEIALEDDKASFDSLLEDVFDDDDDESVVVDISAATDFLVKKSSNSGSEDDDSLIILDNEQDDDDSLVILDKLEEDDDSLVILDKLEEDDDDSLVILSDDGAVEEVESLEDIAATNGTQIPLSQDALEVMHKISFDSLVELGEDHLLGETLRKDAGNNDAPLIPNRPEQIKTKRISFESLIDENESKVKESGAALNERHPSYLSSHFKCKSGNISNRRSLNSSLSY